MNTTTSRLVTSFSTPSILLRRALLSDATLTSVTGIFLLLAGKPLEIVLGIPATMLQIAGLTFILLGAFAAWLGTRPRVHRTLVFVVIVLNVLWAVDSMLMLISRWVQTTPIAELFVIAQAVIVASIAELEFIGLRRSTFVESYARH